MNQGNILETGMLTLVSAGDGIGKRANTEIGIFKISNNGGFVLASGCTDSSVAATQTISFAGTAGGALVLHDPSGAGLGFGGTIAGFGGADTLDLATFSFSGGPEPS